MTRAWIDAREVADAGEVTPATPVAGVPLVARLCRQSARLGWEGADVAVSGTDGRALVALCLERRPPPPGFPVQIKETPAGEGPPPGAVAVDARSIYTSEELGAAAARGGTPQPAPALTLRSAADLGAAERTLLDAARKSVDQDGLISHTFIRPFARVVMKALLDTPVTPNQITMAALVSGVVAGALAATGGYLDGVLAGAIFFIGAAVDCIDGDIARLRIEGSRRGEWLDSLADDVSTTAMLAGVGLGVWASGGGGGWAAFGVLGAAVFAATEARILWELHRAGAAIDTAQFPWWFGKPSEGLGGGAARTGWLAAVGPLLRRDTVVTGTMVFLVLGMPRAALVGIAVGNLTMCALLPVHLAVMARRRRASGARG